MPTVRLARAADAAAIQRIFELSLRGADWLPAGAEPDTDFERNSAGETVYVCLADGAAAADGAGRVIGFLSVYDPGSFIHHLYVDPDAQRQGAGRALLAVLPDRSERPWRLKCVLTNTEARAFYARVGWRETETAMGSQGRYAVLRR